MASEEAITSLLGNASEAIKVKLLSGLKTVLENEMDHTKVILKIGQMYEEAIAPLVHDLLLMEMRFNARLDQVRAKLIEMGVPPYELD